jgi:hypothetical protein
MLAGVTGVTPQGFLPLFVRRYQGLSPHQLVVNKADNLLALVANPQGRR